MTTLASGGAETSGGPAPSEDRRGGRPGRLGRVDPVTAALVLVPPAYVVAVIAFPGTRALVLLLLPLAAIGVWVGLRYPFLLAGGLAVLQGAVPIAKVPFTPVPLVQMLCAGVVLAALIHRTAVSRVTGIERAVWLLIGTSTMGLLVMVRTGADLVEYSQWAVATLLVVGLSRFSTDRLWWFGRLFVGGSMVAALVGIGIRFFDSSGRIIDLLSPVGYGLEDDPTRYAYYLGGRTIRLAGLYIEPNAAGLFLFVATAVAVVVLRGWWRIGVCGVFGFALLLTLSRGAIFSAVGALLLLIVFARLSRSLRSAMIGLFLLGGLAAAALPFVRTRVLTSFNSTDTSSVSRLDALRDFPGLMQGNWLFGKGWALPELTDPATSFTTNIVANTPLLTVYRAGIFAGLAMVVLLVVGCVVSARLLRSHSPEGAIVGAAFIGFTVVALQLDFPVVALPPVTTVFSILLVFLARCDLESRVVEEDEPPVAAPREPVLQT